MTLPDGTIKQVSPFNGTQVWTVPGRANRPFVNKDLPAEPINHALDGYHCSFCEFRYLDSPPEVSRLVIDADDPAAATTSGHHPGKDPDGTTRVREVRHVPASELNSTFATFRRVPNLFPILPLHYWQANHGLALSPAAAAWHRDYLADPLGRDHLLSVARRIAIASGLSTDDWGALPPADKLRRAETFFSSSHDLIIAHRHFSAGATSTDQLASSGTLTPDEHADYLRFTVEAAQSLQVDNPHARYVTIFQNWLRPAGASFDHLHKQLAAIDQLPVQTEGELHRLKNNPNLYWEYGVDYAERQRLVIARNDHAIAFAGFGHRYPSIEVHSLASVGRPWDLDEHQLRGLSDLVHAVHVASGVQTPVNEEWHYQPTGIDLVSPVRVVVKWRTNNLAGFEGATKIYLNTISPWALRDRVMEALNGKKSQLGDVETA